MKAILFPFNLAPNGVIAWTTNYEQVVRGQVIDALMTNQGERVFRPRYGCDIQAALFDPSGELERRDAANVIRTRLEQFVPRCIVRNITVALGDPGTVVFTILYRPSAFATDATLTVPVSSEFLARHRQLQEAPA